MRSLILVITFSLVACQNIFYRSDLQPPLSSTSDNEAIATQATDANLNRSRRQAVSGVNITEEYEIQLSRVSGIGLELMCYDK